MIFIQFIRGFMMAMADSVPGVSGGTIAFVLGFYDRFIQSLHQVISGNKEEKIQGLRFLIKIGGGWIIGITVSILFIASIFESHIYDISSVFLGLILGAIPFIIKEEKDTLKGNYAFVYFTLIGIFLVLLFTYFNPTSTSSYGTITLYILVYIGGIFGISAMVLPGISGSTLLLILGVYGTIINAIKETLHFNLSFLGIVIVFGLGVLSGLVLTIGLVQKALHKHRPQTIYLIIGLMIGSLYAVIMGPSTLDFPQAPMSFESFRILYFLLGVLIIVGLDYLKNYVEKK